MDRDPFLTMYVTGVVALLAMLISIVWAGFRDLFK